MNITLLEPYFTGSHASWAEQYARHSHHRIEILGLPGRHWKWRMHGGAVTLARQFLSSGLKPDLILATDMLDLTTFLALTRERTCRTPVAAYFHENQLTYPWSPDDSDPVQRRDAHYGFINYASALAASRVLFNSDYHRRSFLKALPSFLQAFPDLNERETVGEIEKKSCVLPLGMDLRSLDKFRPAPADDGAPQLVLWNHRWEFDKNPEEFFGTLLQLAEEGIPFQVAVLGESFSRLPPIFEEAKRRLGNRIVHWGYVADPADYARLLWRADILPVTSVHDFFGGSVVQALYCGCLPLLPDRLAYPEHLPPELHHRFLYQAGELAGKLREILNGRRRRDHVDAVRSAVCRYDWEIAGPLYDRVLEESVMAWGGGASLTGRCRQEFR